MSPHRRYRYGDVLRHEVDRRSWYRNVILSSPFEMALALAAMVGSLVFMFDGGTRAMAAIGRFGLTVAWTWNILYLLGGVFILVGILRPFPRMELAGLSMFAAAYAMNAGSLASFTGVRAVVVIGTYVAIAAACGARARLVVALIQTRRDDSP